MEVGLAVGLANLGVNFAMASFDTSIPDQLVTRWAEVSAWSAVFAGPRFEGSGYRLVLPSGFAGVAVKRSAGGLAFGLVFWRRGLPHSILSHSAASRIHQLLMPVL